jgi:hypothetical protein
MATMTSTDKKAQADTWAVNLDDLLDRFAQTFVQTKELITEILSELEKANDFYQELGHLTAESLVMERFDGKLKMLSLPEQKEVAQWLRPTLSQAAVAAILGISTKAQVNREARQREIDKERELLTLADRLNDETRDLDEEDLDEEDHLPSRPPRADEPVIGAAPTAGETQILKNDMRYWCTHPRLTDLRRKAMIRFLNEMLAELAQGAKT